MSKPTTPTRIYVVAQKGDDKAPRRLVRAPNVAQARNHVARETLTTEVATQDDLEQLLPAGVKVEKAGAEPALKRLGAEWLAKQIDKAKEPQ